MTTYERSRGIAPLFMTPALNGGEWSTSRPGPFAPGERASGTHCIGGWVDSKFVGLDAVDKRRILLCRESNPDRPTHSLSLYRLSFSTPYPMHIRLKYIYPYLELGSIEISAWASNNKHNWKWKNSDCVFIPVFCNFQIIVCR
jgi:hypothetical protein